MTTHKPFPILGWLLERASWIGSACPALIWLYSQHSRRKSEFIRDACRILTMENIPFITDESWQSSLPLIEQRVWQAEVNQQRTIHYFLKAKSQTIQRAAKNITHAETILANSLNIIDIVKSNTILMPVESLDQIKKTFIK